MSTRSPATESETRPFTERIRGELPLRERKKLKAMRHIQDVALDLFDAHGYGVVTIERIASEAEVSPSTIYRYFGTKEQLVLYDEYDPMIVDLLETAFPDADPVTAIHRSIGVMVASFAPRDEEIIRRRMAYVMEEPAVRAGMVEFTGEMEELIRQAMAQRTGRDADDLELRVVASGLVAGFVAALEHWHAQGYVESITDLLDRTFIVLTNGMRLD